MDPLNNVQSAPESPEKVPGVPMTDTLVPPAANSEEMKANLADMMAKLDGKFQDFNSNKFSADNQLKDQQGQTLGILFDLLEKAGVDPSNPEEVKAFIENIKMQSPELGDQLEQALQVILGEEEVSSEQVPVENNMNINNIPDDSAPQTI